MAGRIRSGRGAAVATLLCVVASPALQANTWDFSGRIETCNPQACNIAGIAPGNELVGFLKARDDRSRPEHALTDSAVTDYLLIAGAMRVGPQHSDIASSDLMTDAADEIVRGTIAFSGTFDGGTVGRVALAVSLDLSRGTWTATTPYLGLGVVATGTGALAHEPDGDDLAAIEDNCILESNADQRDTDGDGFGNACDADFTDDCTVNAIDLGILQSALFQSGTTDTDMDGDGNTDVADLGAFKGRLFAPPGPSGVPNICSL